MRKVWWWLRRRDDHRRRGKRSWSWGWLGFQFGFGFGGLWLAEWGEQLREDDAGVRASRDVSRPLSPSSVVTPEATKLATVDDGTPTTVIVVPVAGIPGATGVLWAHQTCAPSQVLDDAAMKVDEQDVMVRTLTVDGVPLLLWCPPDIGVVQLGDGSDRADVWATHLLEAGGRLVIQPSPLAFDTAPRLRWAAQLTDGATGLRITDPDGLIVYEGTLDDPEPGWLGLVFARRGFVLVGVPGAGTGDPLPRLHHLAAAGRLVAGAVPLPRRPR